MSIFTLVGFIGIAINLIAYAMLSSGRLKASEARYQLMNITGTVCILLSLVAQWNLPAFIANLAWLLIGLLSLARILWLAKRSRA